MKILLQVKRRHKDCPWPKKYKGTKNPFFIEIFQIISLGTKSGESYISSSKVKIPTHGIVHFDIRSEGFYCPKCKQWYGPTIFADKRNRGYDLDKVRERVWISTYSVKKLKLFKYPLEWAHKSDARPKFVGEYTGDIFTLTSKLYVKNPILRGVQQISLDKNHILVATKMEFFQTCDYKGFFVISVHEFRQIMHNRREGRHPVKL